MTTFPGIRAIAFGIEGLLLVPPQTEGRHDASLFHRMIFSPALEPLAPLFRNSAVAREESQRLLGPFFGEESIPLSRIKDQYANLDAPPEMPSWIASLQREGIQTVVWDNCLTGLTQRIHNLIDTRYPHLFPRSMRLLSTRHGFQLGEEEACDLLWRTLSVSPDDLLVVTANPAHRDFAVRHGLQCFLYDVRSAPEHLAMTSALQVYLGLGGEQAIKDPSRYLTAVAHLHTVGFHLPQFRELLSEITMNQAHGPLEADFRCLLLDRKLHNISEFDGTPLPRFKTSDEVMADGSKLIDGYLAQVERGIPSLARAAMMGLMGEMTSLCRVTDFSPGDIDSICEWVRRINRHMTAHPQLYIEQAKVFHLDEWEALTRMEQDDDEALDRRYSDWVDDTYRNMREMAARNEPTKSIRLLVKERLLDDLVLGMLELEMMKRSLQSRRRRHSMFPRHHDAKNRVSSLTANIGDQQSWIKTMSLHIESLQGWVRSLTLRLARYAQENATRLSFLSEMDASLPLMDLGDFTEEQRESLDHILTELIRNAVKYRNPSVGSRVTVQMVEDEHFMIFRVTDNGLGIKDIKAVLEGGVREHPEIREGYGGGLASVLHHTRAHGWSFQLTSEPFGGTSAELMIPLRGPDSRQKRLSQSGFPVA